MSLACSQHISTAITIKSDAYHTLRALQLGVVNGLSKSIQILASDSLRGNPTTLRADAEVSNSCRAREHSRHVTAVKSTHVARTLRECVNKSKFYFAIFRASLRTLPSQHPTNARGNVGHGVQSAKTPSGAEYRKVEINLTPQANPCSGQLALLRARLFYSEVL